VRSALLFGPTHALENIINGADLPSPVFDMPESLESTAEIKAQYYPVDELKIRLRALRKYRRERRKRF